MRAGTGLTLAALLLAGCGGRPASKTPPRPQAQAQEAGVTSVPARTPVAPPKITAVHMFSTAGGWATTLGGGVLRTTDGGGHWAVVIPPSAAPTAAPPAFFLDAQTAWILRPEADAVEHTADGGRTWQVADLGPNLGAPAAASLDFTDAKYGWLLVPGVAAAGSIPVTLYRTVDGGRTWASLTPTSPASPP